MKLAQSTQICAGGDFFYSGRELRKALRRKENIRRQIERAANGATWSAALMVLVRDRICDALLSRNAGIKTAKRPGINWRRSLLGVLADVLYGIRMQEQGVSTLMSVRLADSAEELQHLNGSAADGRNGAAKNGVASG